MNTFLSQKTIILVLLSYVRYTYTFLIAKDSVESILKIADHPVIMMG